MASCSSQYSIDVLWGLDQKCLLVKHNDAVIIKLDICVFGIPNHVVTTMEARLEDFRQVSYSLMLFVLSPGKRPRMSFQHMHCNICSPCAAFPDVRWPLISGRVQDFLISK